MMNQVIFFKEDLIYLSWNSFIKVLYYYALGVFLYTDYVIWTGYEGLEYELPCYVKYDNLDEINLELCR